MIQFIVTVSYRDTEIAAYQNGKIVWNTVAFTGGADWLFSIQNGSRVHRNLLIGKVTAYKVVHEFISVIPIVPPATRIIRGRDLTSGLPAQAEITSDEASEWISLREFVASLAAVFLRPEHSPLRLPFSEFVPDVLKPALSDHPILLAGEFGTMTGLRQTLETMIERPVILTQGAGLRPRAG